MKKNETKKELIQLRKFGKFLNKYNKENFKLIKHSIDFSSDNNDTEYLVGEFLMALRKYISYINDNVKNYNFSFSMKQINEMMKYIAELNSIIKDIIEISNSCFRNDLIEAIKLDEEKSLKDNKLCFLHTLSYIETMKMLSNATKESIINANAKDKEYTRQLLETYK